MNLSEKIINYIKYLVCGLIIAVPLVYFPTIMMPFQLSKTVLFQVLTEIIFALWIFLVVFNKEYRPKITKMTMALGIFMLVITLSAIFGPDWRMSLWSDESRSLGVIALWHFFGLFLVLSSLRDKINWKQIWKLSFLTAVIVSLIGISQKFIVFPRGANPWLHIIYPGIPERIGSTFSNSAFMAGYLMINFFIGFWLLLKSKKNKNKILIGVGVALITIAIFLSQTLGVISGLIIGVFIMMASAILKSHSQTTRRIYSISLAILIIFGCIFWFTRSADIWQKIPGIKRVAGVSLQGESIHDRLITWQLSLKSFKEKPLFGWGFENFRVPFNKFYDPKLLDINAQGTYWDKPHNIVLEYLASTGIIGLLAYLGIFVAAFYKLFKDKFEYRLFFATAIIAYFIQNLFVFDTIGTYLMFFLMLAFIDNYSDKQTESAHQKTDNNVPMNQKIVLGFLLVIALMPVFYNYQIIKGANYEYWGVNYFLNQMEESSLLSFNKAIMTSSPYVDDIRKNFANTVKQAYQQGIVYQNIGDLQDKLVGHLKMVIERHPSEFLNYINLAEFENIFYKFDKNYLKEAEELSLKALEISPKRQQAYYVLGKTKLLQGDINGAYKAFENAVNVNPEAAEPHFYFGLAAYGVGDAKTGMEEITKAESLGRKPQKIEEFIVLANYVGDLNHDYKKSIEYYKMALILIDGEIYKDFSNRRQEVLLKLAIAYYFDHNYPKAKEIFLELEKNTDLKILPIYPDLKPVLDELKIN